MTDLAKTSWTVDPVHSEVQFKVKHLTISNIAGNFTAFEGNFESENEDFAGSKVHFKISTSSVTAKNIERHQHLISDAFFNSAQFPEIIFDGLVEK